MRFLLALVVTAFMVLVGIPTMAAADAAGSPMAMDGAEVEVVAAVAAVFNPSDLELDVVRDFTIMASPGLHPRRDQWPSAVPSRTGPNGFQSGIWRPVDRIESTSTLNYESGVLLIRR
jgi:hypothetical protein